MVTLSVPKDYTLSASEGTPHLMINHDVAAELDSSNAFEGQSLFSILHNHLLSFSGPEKLLEVWFAPSATSLPTSACPDGLKKVTVETWTSMLDIVNCKILSILKSDTVDAYLLSESSMFVFPHKLILKTCGTTTLLLGLQLMLHIAAADAGFPFRNAESVDDIRATAIPHRVFYSRKNFLFPEKQRGPHRSWKQEVKYLDDTVHRGGSAYMVGKMNGDHWYLYITHAKPLYTPPLTPSSDDTQGCAMNDCLTPKCASNVQSQAPVHIDETLEILMTDLHPGKAQQFFLSKASAIASDSLATDTRHLHSCEDPNSDSSATVLEEIDVFAGCGDSDIVDGGNLNAAGELTTERHALGSLISRHCGLSEIYPGSVYPDARVDAYLFSPCGFSANGVIPAADPESKDKYDAAHYFTVHVTPESGFSYASFETNVPGGQTGRTTSEIIDHVVRIFQPGRFSVTLFEAKDEDDNFHGVGKSSIKKGITTSLAESVPGYRRVDRIVYDFEDYSLIFRFYERDDLVEGKAARVGEEI